MSSVQQQLEKQLGPAVDSLLTPTGKADLFAVAPKRATAEAPLAAPRSAVSVKTPTSRRPTPKARRVVPTEVGEEPELERALPEQWVRSTYLIGKLQDDKLRRLAVRQKLPLDETVRLALQAYIEAHSLNQDLTQVGTSPIDNPAKSEPGMPRVGIRLRPDQAEVLRQCRLLFGIEASEIIRRSIDEYYAQATKSN